MVNSTVKATGNFPERVRKRLHRLLKSESIEGYWAAGRILNKHFGERAAYGEMPKIEAELKSLGDAATSLSQLHQCRRLNATWEKNVAAATRAGLPWGRVIVLISIWGEGIKREQPGLIKLCKQMIEEVREFLPREAHAACGGLKTQAEGMIAVVEMLYKAHTVEKSKSKKAL